MSGTQQAPLLPKEVEEEMEEASEAGGYYGKNDWKPFRAWSCGKKLCICGTFCLLCFYAWRWLLLLFVIMVLSSLLFMKCIGFKKGQEGTAKVLMFEFLNKAPGMKLNVKASAENTSDIVIPSKLVDENGVLYACGGRGWSLRKSLEHTVDDHIRNGPHGAKVLNDTDVDKPRYLLNGSTFVYDPNFDEIWTCPGRFCLWPAVYSWSSHLPEGMGAGLTQCIDLKDAPDIFGYILLFEIANKEFYDTDRIVKVGRGAVNCPEITSENEGKIFARYNYYKAREMGNIEDLSSVPDAYILKGKTLKDAQLKLLHTYRVMKPAVGAI